MRKKAKLQKRIVASAVAVLLLILFLSALWQGIAVKEYTQTTDLLSKNVKIALITDLHNTVYGKNQKNLIEKIQEQAPDLIMLVGDIADEKTSHDGTKQLLSVIGTQYPCFYVTGNHEFWTNEIDSVKEMIASYGVTILSGETQTVTINGEKLLIGGVDDPDGFYDESEAYLPKSETLKEWKNQVESVCEQNNQEYYSILLSHRPEQTEVYKSNGYNLVLSGHAHGGQVRIPWLLNGLYAPNQGFFPEFSGGVYDLGETDLIVSRGLCKDWKPRIFNPPELVIVNLEPDV